MQICKYKCKFDRRKCNSNQKLNNGKCWRECKKHHIFKKDYTWNPATFSCKNEICWHVNTWDEAIKQAKAVARNYNEIKEPVKYKISIF